VTLQDVRELFDYNRWANARTLASLAPLTPDEFGRDLGSSFPSVQATVTHIAAAEWVWLCRWKGSNPTAMPEWAAAMSREAVIARFDQLEAERTAYLDTLTEADVNRRLTFTLFNGTQDAQPLSAQFQHVVNHGTYHRGQVATLLRQLGAAPASTDLIRWMRERPDRS
jgi:uncharacterized damage-inducible protein DinB